MSLDVDPTVTGDIGLSYVNQVLGPFRMPDGEHGKPFFDTHDVQTIESLVDLFGPDIKEQHIKPEDFLEVVVGSAALRGVQLSLPSSPSLFLTFSEQARLQLDAYYESMEIEEGPVQKFY